MAFLECQQMRNNGKLIESFSAEVVLINIAKVVDTGEYIESVESFRWEVFSQNYYMYIIIVDDRQ